MMSTSRVLAGMLFLLSATAFAAPSTGLGPGIDTLAIALGRKFIADPFHVGLSIGIVSGGTRRSFHFGSIDRQQASTPTAHTIYELASLTKSYTGMLLAQAVIDQKLSLDDDVRRYLPAECANLAYEGHPIRVVDLASHTSGLPKNLPAFAAGATPQQLLAQYEGMSRERFLAALGQLQLTQRPGSAYAYSNTGAQLAGIVLEQVYGASYDVLVQRLITGPHHMPDTGTAVAPGDAGRYAKRYSGKGVAMPELSFWRTLPAAGYLKSTIDDQLRYLAWNLDESDPVVALAHRVTFRHTEERDDDIGLFWYVNHGSDGRRLVRHAGGSFGTTSFELLYPDARVGIVLLANDADGSTEKTLAEMADKLAAALINADAKLDH